MSTVASVVAILACSLCAACCFAIALAGLTSSDDEDEYRLTGTIVAAVPGVCFAAAAVHFVLNF